MENINASAHTNHTRFWVERYKALRLNTQHNGQLIPVPCTLCYCPPDDCGMEELLACTASCR